jgi:hypothetical protein
MGTAIDTSAYSGGECWTIDVTAYMNASLASGRYFTARLEATVPPASLSGHQDGHHDVPSKRRQESGTDTPSNVEGHPRGGPRRVTLHGSLR